MGMFTELNIACQIKDDPDVIKTLKMMTSTGCRAFNPPFNHDFFRTEKWLDMLLCDSVYFPVYAHSEVIVEKVPQAYERVLLNVRCDFKNYDNEIEEFLDWLAPYILTKGFIGYKRHETDAFPTLIFIEEEGVEYVKTTAIAKEEYVRIPQF